ncbi:HEAT repeat domain-containing protein [Streptomyces griseoluteus]|uniref:HEAT repeat domain-containing protein n=1 Tax=Streptomyces griseoluteus TaxID=29306 RepID=UPI0037002D44
MPVSTSSAPVANSSSPMARSLGGQGQAAVVGVLVLAPGRPNVAGWRAAAAEVGPEELLPWYEEQLAAATDADQRAQLQEIRDWVAAGNSPDARWSALQSYDAVLAELPGLLALLHDDDDARLRARIAYLLAWFPEFSPTSVPRLLALAAHEKDPVTAATALLAAGLVGPSSMAEDITPYLDATADPLMRWAAATALIRLAGLGGSPVGPGLLGRAVTELTAAARSPFDRVTEYCEGDLFGHIERTLRQQGLQLPTQPPLPAKTREQAPLSLSRRTWQCGRKSGSPGQHAGRDCRKKVVIVKGGRLRGERLCRASAERSSLQAIDEARGHSPLHHHALFNHTDPASIPGTAGEPPAAQHHSCAPPPVTRQPSSTRRILMSLLTRLGTGKAPGGQPGTAAENPHRGA